MGELSRALGLSLILVLQRTQRIRREYPTWRYVAASLGIGRGGGEAVDARGRPLGPRPRPFPPARDPWRYAPRSSRDPDFNMIYAMISTALVGSAVGGNMPAIPSSVGALIGAASFAFACTWKNSPRGDLMRTIGMRVVRIVTELWEIQADLQIIPKATVVSSQIIDKAMVWDSKHKVKDRFLSLANKGYARASKVAEQIQEQQRGSYNHNQYRDENRRNTDRRNNDGDRRYRREFFDEDDSRRESGRNRRRARDDEDDKRFQKDPQRRQRRRYGDMDESLKNYSDERRSEYSIMDNPGREERGESYENKAKKKSKLFFWR